METPIIFLATADQDLEDAAVAAALRADLTLCRARNLHYGCQILGSHGFAIVLAIIDVDLRQGNRSLVHVLANCRHDYPIIAAAEDPNVFERDRIVRKTAAGFLIKPAIPGEIDALLDRHCRWEANLVPGG